MTHSTAPTTADASRPAYGRALRARPPSAADVRWNRAQDAQTRLARIADLARAVRLSVRNKYHAALDIRWTACTRRKDHL